MIKYFLKIVLYFRKIRVYISERGGDMSDKEILALLQQRDPAAIERMNQAFGPYCRQIARNILSNEEDVEECLNDTYLNVWNAIPPACPENLGAYIASVTRNLAFNRYRRENADKRGGGNIPLVLSELSDVVSNTPTPEQALETKELVQAINDFLSGLSTRDRYLFIRRYWYAEPVELIASALHRSKGAVSMKLSRLRRKLHKYLTERGFDL